MDNRPIGMFDSGFGGLTVLRALIDVAPKENIIYVGDTARYPYGSKPLEEVRSYSIEIATRLVSEFGVKMVVVACNTASSVVLDTLSSTLEVPVIGVIEPGVRAALIATSTDRVGVIGTVGTISSGSYQRAFVDYNIKLTCAACPGFVEFVERGETTGDEVHVLAERLLQPIIEADVDTLLLGCTHYPFLARTISDVLGREVTLVSSADETAFQIARELENLNLDNQAQDGGKVNFYSSASPEYFAEIGQRLLGFPIDDVIAW